MVVLIVPQPGECEHLTLTNLEAERLHVLAVSRALIESVCRNQAGLRPERIAEWRVTAGEQAVFTLEG